MRFKPGNIDGLIVTELKPHNDARGWLIEIFRKDEILENFVPEMAYISSTRPGIVRGPHEHKEQSDFFSLAGPSTFRVHCWDNRSGSPTFGNMMIFEGGAQRPISVLIPPGVVHAYKNIGNEDGWIVNLPNRLYAGEHRKYPVDEIRHENDAHSIFTVD